jgi:hypothetical protein
MSLSSHHEHELSLTVIGIGFAFHIDHASDHSLALIYIYIQSVNTFLPLPRNHRALSGFRNLRRFNVGKRENEKYNVF